MPTHYKTVALSPLRKVISTRMTEATQNIPHFRMVADIEMDALLAQRQQLNAENPDAKVSVNDYLIKACAIALMENPQLNIQFVDKEIHQYPQADIAVIVSIDGGLLTPIVRNANNKTLEEIAVEMKDLAARAVAGQLKMDEIIGGTFSLSNLGMFGVDQFDAIINAPQAAILAVGQSKTQPVVRDGEMAIATVMRVSLSMDHRVVDGAIGAQFMTTLQKVLHNPECLKQ